MDKKFRSILEELCDYQPEKEDLLIEYRAQQIITAAHNLIKQLKERYDEETAEDLSRRLLRSITSGDEEKFNRKIRAIRESELKKTNSILYK